MSARILLLSAYDASSHRQWRETLAAMFPDYEWIQLALPPRHFNWRIRGNSLHWAFNDAEQLQQEYDLVIATSMVDLSSLRGLVPALARIPTVVYFHENQFTYPIDKQRSENVEPQLVPLYSALCADEILFNSEYNRSSFLNGVKSLFKRLPDKLPPSIIEKLSTSQVLPVPIRREEKVRVEPTASNPELLEIVWNHRWEYDKGPGLLLEVCRLICQQHLPIRVHVLGEQFRQIPAQFAELENLLNGHHGAQNIAPGEFGFVAARNRYEEILGQCDVVLSTALHDFQGLAIMEAALKGCTPLAPNALAYPEYLGPEFLYANTSEVNEVAAGILEQLRRWQQQKLSGEALPKADLNDYLAKNLKAGYAAVFERLIHR